MPTNQTHRTLSDETWGLIFGLIGVIVFSGTLPATRIAVGTFDPWFLTFGRAALATAAALLVLAITRRSIPKSHFLTLFCIGILVVFGFPGFAAFAMLTVPSAHGGVVLGILPLATAIFATLLAGERPSPLFWICGVIGALLIFAFVLRDGGWELQLGDLWLLIAGLCASAGFVLSGKLSHYMSGWEVISWALILTLPISIIGTSYYWQWDFLSAPASHNWSFLYVAFGSMYFGFFAWNAGLKRGGISRVGQLQLLQTFFTLAIAATLLGEEITLETFFFAIAVLVVVLIGRKAQVGQKAT